MSSWSLLQNETKMKKFHETQRFQCHSAFVRVHLLLSRGLSVEAVSLFTAGCVQLTQKRFGVVIATDDDARTCLERSRLADIFYSQCQKAANRVSNPNLDITVRFSDSSIGEEWVEIVPSIRKQEVDQSHNVLVAKFPQVMPLMIFPPLPPIEKIYRSILFAGTFDHLHAGHRSILTQALFLVEDTLYVAITTEELLLRKRCRSAIEPFDTRVINVDNFIRSIVPECKKDLEIVILPTPDSVGPAGYLDFDAIIVTPETIQGGHGVNDARVACGKSPVEIVTLDILDHASVEYKLSSSNFRSALCDVLPGGEADLNELHSCFVDGLCRRIMEDAAIRTVGEVWWSKLRDMQGLEPWRNYHTLRHVLELIHAAKEHYQAVIPVEIALAIWFHDCVYDPRSPCNEDKSVHVFEGFADKISLPLKLKEEVACAILYTKKHVQNIADNGTPQWMCVFLELDLAILGSFPDRYQEYKSQIRSEFSYLDDERFRRGRREFLEGISTLQFRYLRNKDDLNLRFTKNVSSEISELS